MDNKTILGYTFKKLDIDNIVSNNDTFCEQLEFLGDGLINGFVITSIYKKFVSEKDLGQIARIKSLLISKTNFSYLVDKLNIFENYIKNKSVKKKSDLIEILFGAIYLDSDYKISTIERLYLKFVDPFVFDIMKNKSVFDFKSILQSYTQKSMKTLPKYEIINHIIKEKKHIFLVKLSLNDMYVISRGNCLTSAEQTAASFLSRFLQIDTDKLY